MCVCVTQIEHMYWAGEELARARDRERLAFYHQLSVKVKRAYCMCSVRIYEEESRELSHAYTARYCEI